MVKLGVLISGGGSNLQAIIDACEKGILKGKAEVSVVISNKAEAFGLERAKKHGIPAVFIDKKLCSDAGVFCGEIRKELVKHRADLVCLAGYLLKLEPGLVQGFKIINIHPALLPKYGGKGMYGHFVHEAVLEAGEKETGATVHWVDEHYDNGKIIIQRKVPVEKGDTPETLAKRVLAVEHRIYPEAILKAIEQNNLMPAR
jgi:phosphoribosylglycinamide formyltransferase-1